MMQPSPVSAPNLMESGYGFAALWSTAKGLRPDLSAEKKVRRKMRIMKTMIQ